MNITHGNYVDSPQTYSVEPLLKDIQRSVVLIEIFGNHSDEKCIRKLPVIMPYLRHIVEQPIEGFYCSLLISLKLRIRIMLLIPACNKHSPHLKALLL